MTNHANNSFWSHKRVCACVYTLYCCTLAFEEE